MPLDVARKGTLDVKDPPLKAIVAANDNYEEGYHEGNPGGLDAVDTDLAPGNIKDGETIFGKLGTFAGAAPTITEPFAAQHEDGFGDTWETIGTCLAEIPDTAVEVYCVILSIATAAKGETQALYNGVQKAFVTSNGNATVPVQWIGPGLGFAADLELQTRANVSDTYHGFGAAGYTTA